METALRRSHKLTELPRDATLRVRNGHDRIVAVFEGQIWVTQNGDAHDFILGAGESLMLDRPGLAVVQGLRDSRIMVLEPEADAGRPDVYELYRQARALRSIALGNAIAAGFAALQRGVARALTGGTPRRPLTAPRRWAAQA